MLRGAVQGRLIAPQPGPQIERRVGNQPGRDAVTKGHVADPGVGLPQRVPEPDQVEVEIAVDGGGQDRSGIEEERGGDLDIDKRQLRGAVHAVEVDMFDPHERDADEYQGSKERKPCGAGIARQRVDPLQHLIGELVGHEWRPEMGRVQ